MATESTSSSQHQAVRPEEAVELLTHLPDLEQALAFYHQHLAPPTAIDLSVAENVLVYQDSMQKLVFDYTRLLPEQYINYFSPYGIPALRRQVAELLTRAFGATVAADDVFGTAGVASALECLAFALKDKPRGSESGPPPLVDGDAVLLPAPFWQGFNWSFEQRPKLTCVPVNLPTSGPKRFQLTLDLIKDQYEATRKRTGKAPRLLVLTNPHNPLGVNYPKELLEQIYAWALDHTDMHIVSDEIYCHSQLPKTTVTFTSAVALSAYAKSPERVHVVWGFAKDFGLSGLRTGFLVSKYGPVQRAMLGTHDVAEKRHPMSWFTPFDSLKHFVIGAVLTTTVNGSSELYTTYAMKRYPGLLDASFTKVKARLDANKLPYVHEPQSNAAQFFWLDLTSWLGKRPPKSGDDVSDVLPLKAHDLDPDELFLFNYLAGPAAEVTLLPGGVMSCPAPGFFRLCYTARQPDEVCTAVDRVAKALGRLGTKG
ncbi:pyridoxal phosphate-dependent aminotransferase [Streptomyces sp. NPDC001739]